MSAFSRAVATLHANLDVSVACTWHPGWDRPAPRTVLMNLETETYSMSVEGLAIRGVRSQASGGAFGAGPRGAVADRQSVDIAIADVPDGLEHGDLLIIEGATFMVEEAPRDVEGVTWNITLSDAA